MTNILLYNKTYCIFNFLFNKYTKYKIREEMLNCILLYLETI